MSTTKQAHKTGATWLGPSGPAADIFFGTESRSRLRSTVARRRRRADHGLIQSYLRQLSYAGKRARPGRSDARVRSARWGDGWERV
jgi:hypothetical protein